jgi:hypothetical protein
MLGHATISQTMDTYSHVMPGMGDIAAEALESALKADCDDTYPRITLWDATRLRFLSGKPFSDQADCVAPLSFFTPLSVL